MEDGAVVDIRNSTLVARLVLPIDTVLAFSRDQHLGQPQLVMPVRPLVADVFAGVEEPSKGGSHGADATLLPLHHGVDDLCCDPGTVPTYSYRRTIGDGWRRDETVL